MANPEHVAKLKEGVMAWNQWRQENPDADPDLIVADLRGAQLRGANLREAKLIGADLICADLTQASLIRANLREARLCGSQLVAASLTGATIFWADLREAVLTWSDLSGANVSATDVSKVDLRGANLSKADFIESNLTQSNLSGADLRGANLRQANLSEANLNKADLSGANLRGASLVGTNFEEANLTGCNVYGISAWDIRLEGAIQSNLVITPHDESPIQVDNLEVAQFIYLLLNNKKIRRVIDTITSKVVLILGRFTPERKAVLDAIRDELRKRDYLPILFDFQKPESKDLTGTVTTLANMARFVIADLTEPSSVPHELATIAPSTVVPVQTILLNGQREYAMFPDLMRRHHWVLEPYQYESSEALIAHLDDRVIAPAEAKAKELTKK
jgi:uncharacterized protein YjbI with pentapeptide repeats